MSIFMTFWRKVCSRVNYQLFSDKREKMLVILSVLESQNSYKLFTAKGQWIYILLLHNELYPIFPLCKLQKHVEIVILKKKKTAFIYAVVLNAWIYTQSHLALLTMLVANRLLTYHFENNCLAFCKNIAMYNRLKDNKLLLDILLNWEDISALGHVLLNASFISVSIHFICFLQRTQLSAFVTSLL